MSFARSLAIFSIASLLAACGGGGGGGTSGGGNTTVPTAPSGANMMQQSVQRADAQSALAGVQAMREANGGSATPFTRRRNSLKAAVTQARRLGMFGSIRPMATATTDPNCNGSGQSTTTTAGPNGSIVFTISSYYDASCTQIQDVVVWTATQNGSTVSGPATATLYSTSGTVTETANAQLTFVYTSSTLQTLTGLSVLMTSIVSNGKQQGEVGVGCSSVSTTSVSCGVAVAADVYASSIEQGANVSLTATTTSTGATMSMQASAYQSSLDGLTVAAAQFPGWTISPASAQTGSVAVSGSQSGSTVSLTVTDTTNGGTVAISGSVAGTMTGSLSRSDTGASVGSFTIDGFGNGTLTYGSGTQVSIVNYAVQG